MGVDYASMENSTEIEKILYYYLFQKKIRNIIKGNGNLDSNIIEKGYIIHQGFISKWKSIVAYAYFKDFFKAQNIISNDLTETQKKQINEFINYKKIIFNKLFSNFSHNYYLTNINRISFNRKDLENFIDKETFKKFNIIEDILYIEIEYIIKKQMFIFILKKNKIIKILIHSISREITNLTFIFTPINIFNSYCDLFRKYSSEELMQFLLSIDIFSKPFYIDNDITRNEKKFIVYNEEKYRNNKCSKKGKESSYKGEEKEIELPQNIKFNLVEQISFRGLDNVGATCYMNATLQCLANIKPVTGYLLNQNIYSYLFDNAPICLLTLEYIQVLVGLYCNQSRTGSYSPKNFKKIISELNPLFKGIQANDSKDLIIFLLEVMNNELVKIHNKKRNIKTEENEKENESYQQIDISNEKMVLQNFINEYKKTHCSVIGDNLCGFQKSVFICESCGGKAINFNIFNFLIFSLEATSNYFNLNNNINIPIINFDNCFQFLSKVEIFQNTYCQKCKQLGNSKYQDTLYVLPNYLIIILNRGKGNIFNCKVNIPEVFCPSNYVENEKDKSYSLIGIVSHFGESGMGGHFIAFCKHYIDGKWRCYNDSIVVECNNDYLNKGTPYILFYKKEISNNNNSNQVNQVGTNINFFNQNSQVNPLNQNNQINYGQNFNINNSNQMNINYNNLPQNFDMNNINNLQFTNNINNFINNDNINNYEINNNINNDNNNNNNYNINNNISNNNINNCQQNNNINNINMNCNMTNNINNCQQNNNISNINMNNNINNDIMNNCQQNNNINNDIMINCQQNNNINNNIIMNNYQQNNNIYNNNNNFQENQNMNNNNGYFANNSNNNNFQNNYQQGINLNNNNNFNENNNFNNNFQQNFNNNNQLNYNNFQQNLNNNTFG